MSVAAIKPVAANTTQAKILVVEDEAIVARDIQMQLLELGYRPVGHAISGEQALQLAAEVLPDLVLMDIQLAGGMDGIRVAELLRERLHLPVVFVTAFAAADLVERAKRVEPFGYILKPFSDLDLRTVVEMALYKSRAELALRQYQGELEMQNAHLRQSQIELEAARDRYANLYEYAPVSYITVNDAGLISSANLTAVAMLGVDRSRLISRSFNKLVADCDLARWRKFLATLQRQEQHVTELHLQHVDGHVIAVLVDGRRAENGVGSRLNMALTDITPLKQARQRLRLSDHALRAISQGVVIADSNQHIKSVNQAFTDITGYGEAELLGQSCNLLQGPQTSPETVAQMREALRAGREFSGEILNYRKDGNPFWNELSISPVRDEEGQLTHFVGVIRDITARKEGDALLSATLAAAVRASQAKSDFLARMSHELRTPLNAMLGFAQLLAANPRLEEGARGQALAIEQSGDHLLALINDLIDLARVESGNVHLSLGPVSLQLVVVECLTMVGPMAAQRGVRLQLHNDTESWVLADYVRLRQVLINLLSNAIKYNRPDGAIQVGFTRLPEQMRISVTDHGLGVAAESRAEVFTAFARLGAEYSAIDGLGIGMAISKSLVEAMGGCIGFDSEPGQGSTFWVELPLAPIPGQTRGRPSPALPAPPVADQQATILHIEDNPANLRLLREIFAEWPHLTLHEVERAEHGLALARSELPALILLDINLPDMDGFAVFDALRADTRTGHIPVIAISANATPGARRQALARGFFDYLTKPVNISLLRDTLHRALGGE